MVNLFKKLFLFLDKKEKKKVYLLFFMVFIMALLDALGIASIMPFIAVLTNPEIINKSALFIKVFEVFSLFGEITQEEFIFAFGVMVFSIFILSLVFKTITIYLQMRFIYMQEFSIGKKLVSVYLNQPYSWFLNHHSSELEKKILSETREVVERGIGPMIIIISQSMVVLVLLILLMIINYKITLIAFSTFGFIYWIIYKFVRNNLGKIGLKRVKVDEGRFRILSDAFGSIKEIKLANLNEIFLNRFSLLAKKFSSYQITAKVIGQLQRYIMEALIYGGMLLLILFLMRENAEFKDILPLIALFAFAGYRLMPSLQHIYMAATQLRFVGATVDSIHSSLNVINLTSLQSEDSTNNFVFDKQVEVKNVNFKYNDAQKQTLRDIDFTILSNSIIGLIGSTGSGKTTLVDILVGLLKPQEGFLEVDGKRINDQNIKEWQKLVGYVPQQTFLSDDTIASNIAYGVDLENIKQEKLEYASKIACLHDFISNDLPKKYNTKVGERGVKLSGGQIQRISIARALYFKPKFLVLDEATSSLDNETEKLVIESMSKMSEDITIVMIAHRISSLKMCDKIFLIEKGELKNNLTYDELINKNLK